MMYIQHDSWWEWLPRRHRRPNGSLGSLGQSNSISLCGWTKSKREYKLPHHCHLKGWVSILGQICPSYLFLFHWDFRQSVVIVLFLFKQALDLFSAYIPYPIPIIGIYLPLLSFLTSDNTRSSSDKFRLLSSALTPTYSSAGPNHAFIVASLSWPKPIIGHRR